MFSLIIRRPASVNTMKSTFRKFYNMKNLSCLLKFLKLRVCPGLKVLKESTLHPTGLVTLNIKFADFLTEMYQVWSKYTLNGLSVSML